MELGQSLSICLFGCYALVLHARVVQICLNLLELLLEVLHLFDWELWTG